MDLANTLAAIVASLAAAVGTLIAWRQWAASRRPAPPSQAIESPARAEAKPVEVPTAAQPADSGRIAAAAQPADSGRGVQAIRIKGSQVLQPPRRSRLVANTDIRQVRYGPDGKRLAMLVDDDRVYLWDVGRAVIEHTAEAGRKKSILGLRWLDAETLLFVMRSRRERDRGSVFLRTWHIVSRVALDRPLAMEGTGPYPTPFLPNAEFLVLRTAGKETRIIKVSDRSVIGVIPSPVHAVGSSPDARTLILAGATLSTFDVSTRAERTLASLLPGSPRLVAVDPDGALIAVAVDDEVRLFEAGTGNPTVTLSGHGGNITDMKWSRDGRLLATVATAGGVIRKSQERSVRIWDPGTGIMLAAAGGHADGIASVDWHPHDEVVATGSFDGTARLWSLARIPKA